MQKLKFKWDININKLLNGYFGSLSNIINNFREKFRVNFKVNFNKRTNSNLNSYLKRVFLFSFLVFSFLFTGKVFGYDGGFNQGLSDAPTLDLSYEFDISEENLNRISFPHHDITINTISDAQIKISGGSVYVLPKDTKSITLFVTPQEINMTYLVTLNPKPSLKAQDLKVSLSKNQKLTLLRLKKRQSDNFLGGSFENFGGLNYNLDEFEDGNENEYGYEVSDVNGLGLGLGGKTQKTSNYYEENLALLVKEYWHNLDLNNEVLIKGGEEEDSEILGELNLNFCGSSLVETPISLTTFKDLGFILYDIFNPLPIATKVTCQSDLNLGWSVLNTNEVLPLEHTKLLVIIDSKEIK